MRACPARPGGAPDRFGNTVIATGGAEYVSGPTVKNMVTGAVVGHIGPA
jgi:hypothetical protein